MARAERRTGFTLVELLVVIALIALLIAIILMSVEQFQQSARNAMDQVRQRNLIQANVNYTGDYKGRWLNPMTSGDPTQDEWVRCYGNNIGSGNRELIDALEEGAAWEYLGQDPLATSPRSIRRIGSGPTRSTPRSASGRTGTTSPAATARRRTPSRRSSSLRRR